MVLLLAAGCTGRQTAGEGGDTQSGSDYGATLYKRKCASCHSLVSPTDKTDEEWPEIVADHESRIRLSEGEHELIVNFLTQQN